MRTVSTKAGCRINYLNSDEIVKEGDLWVQPLEMNLICTYEQLYNFARFVESAEKVVMINEVSAKNRTFPGKRLNCDLKIKVYLNI